MYASKANNSNNNRRSRSAALRAVRTRRGVDKFSITLPRLYKEQREAIFCDEQYGFTIASTKSGKTVGCMAWLLNEAVRKGAPGRRFLWVAPSSAQAKIPFDRMLTGLKGVKLSSRQAPYPEITLPNGSVLMFKTGEKPQLLYGEDNYAVVIDEASRMRQEAYDAVVTTLTATKGNIRLIGNIRTKNDWFYLLAQQAKKGLLDNAHYAIMTSAIAVKAGVITEEAVQRARQQMTEAEFDAAYHCIPYEALFNPFGGEEQIRKAIAPMSYKEPVAWGIDPARAADLSADNSIAIGLDAEGDVCRIHNIGGQALHLQRNDIEQLIGTRAYAVIERNGLGRAIADEMEMIGGARIESFNTTNASKAELVHNLRWAMDNGRIHYPDNPDLIREMIDYERQETARGLITFCHPPNGHDDYVDALMLAWRAYNNRKQAYAQWADEVSM